MVVNKFHRGWGGYVLQEKIKGIKQRLKIWNKEKFGDIQRKMTRTERELNLLEKGDERQLGAQEIRRKQQLQEELWVAANSHESLLRQKSRTKWQRRGLQLPL